MGTATIAKAEITPLLSNNVYGSAIDVTDFIPMSGVANIRLSIDSGDYDVGVYRYSDLSLTALNVNGIFNDESDTRSIFPLGRDRAKVDLKFVEVDDDGNETTTISYRGLINDEATRTLPKTDQIKMRVLSRDSVVRNTKVSAGAIPNGTLASTAIETILTDPRIASVLTVSSANINVDQDITIDDGSKLENITSKVALDRLLFATNSVLVVDSSDTVFVKSRDENTTKNILNLFGPHDIHRRENIIDLTAYNSGLHRMFSSVRVNDTEKSDSGLVEAIGARQKSVTLNFITDQTTEAIIADRVLNEFKAPKIECSVMVKSALAKDVDLLDRVSINYPLRITPSGSALPVVGITQVGDTAATVPNTFGSLSIHPTVGFKVIEITENLRNFTTILKLRQIGKTLSDGVFNTPGSQIVGFGVVGVSTVASGTISLYNPSVVGAAQVGDTVVS